MSCAPRSQIQHVSPYRRHRCRGILFVFPPDQDVRSLLPGARNSMEANERLRELIDAHARTLQLPAAAVVTDRSEPGDDSFDDPLSAATVLAKSSDRVYLRDKAPNLSRIQAGRRVILIVPEERRQG